MKSNVRGAIYPFDWLIIGYSLLMVGAVLGFGRPIANYVDELFFYSSMAALSALIVRYVDPSRSRGHAFVRLLYPAMMFTFFYRATGGTMFLLFDQFFDSSLVSFETSLFGIEPTLWIDQHLPNLFVTELLSACYFCYYLMIPGFVLTLFIKRRYDILVESTAAIALTFFFSYMLFMLYPIEGPRWHFVGQYVNSVDGPVFRQMVEYVIANGAVRGGCMPSTHVAVALVILCYTYRHYRRMGLLLIPINLGLAAGTVWGRFHYISDVAVGAAIAIGSVLLMWRFHAGWLEVSDSAGQPRKVSAKYVS